MNHTKNRAISCCSRECRIIFNPQIPSEPNNRLGIPTATHDYFPQIHNLFVNLRSLFRQQTPTPSPSQRRSNPVWILQEALG
ncbi:hypothetical protein L1987_42460 [Smallanthus sonchifolius]|uniref:Uncharacterized protein n=1 Tax=Smallanthus sonchifolius TaxID=185202 RepID=A0ACB9GJJ1_9ASTR|nr:hypothetical protein L1987_42460 [Smallanthus sonchifolius]